MAPPEIERGRPRQAASATSTPIKVTSNVLLTESTFPGCLFPEHDGRLAVAGVGRCDEHGCPLCGVHPLGSYCMTCDLLAIEVAKHEGPAADPFCMFHGFPTAETRRNCTTCRVRMSRAKRIEGWKSPTGHEGPDCCHCVVCGLCKGSGRVCRTCWLCIDHQGRADIGDCEVRRWDRRSGEDRLIGYDHQLWTPSARSWCA